MEFDNAAWVAGLQAGRDEVLVALRARLRRGLAAALRGRSDVCDSDLDDFSQDAVLRILDRLESFRGESGFTTWAMAVAVRVAMTALRRRPWQSVEPLDSRLREYADVSSGAGAVGSSGERVELLETLRAAIAEQLTPRQRQVLLAELDGVPQVVLADRLGATPGAIYKVSHDARRKLRRVLERAGYDAGSVRAVLAAKERE